MWRPTINNKLQVHINLYIEAFVNILHEVLFGKNLTFTETCNTAMKYRNLVQDLGQKINFTGFL